MQSTFVFGRRSPLVRAALLAVAALLPSMAVAAPFTPGNIVTTRVVGGSGSYTVSNPTTGAGGMTTPANLTGGGAPSTVVVEEWTQAGAFVQAIQMPNVAAVSGNRALTFAGTANTEGIITLSGNGQYLSLGGYNATGTGVNSGGNVTTSVTSGV